MLNGLLTIDTAIYMRVNRLQANTFCTRFCKIISHSGDGHLYAGILLLAYLFEPAGGTALLAAGIACFAIELPLFVLLKALVKRERPCDQLPWGRAAMLPSDQFSMLSGHTSAAFIMAALLSMYSPVLGPVAYLWAILIGLSRVALGVHYPSDIAAGALLGTGVAAMVLPVLLQA